MRTTLIALIVVLALPSAALADENQPRLSLRRLASAPVRATLPTAADILALQKAALDSPTDRAARFSYVRALMDTERLDDALTAARDWRARDAYNLVVVRLLGDIYAARGESMKALRTWSAVAELLPENPGAQRALATVLKQSGHVDAAYDRLMAAAALRPDDVRIAFELADVADRLGKRDEARQRFAAIAENKDASHQVAYPAKRRLEQLDGGVQNDIKIYLTWDVDRSDIDLWVTNPAGQKVFYSRKKGKYGGQLYDDVTSGYGPEFFVAKAAKKGTYQVAVNYYGTTRQAFREARGEVVVVLDEGRPTEQRHVLPYRLYEPKQTVTVARVTVNPEAVR